MYVGFDDLGRVVIPKEIRRTLRIREGDPLEIFTDREGEIILKKIFTDRRACCICRYVCRQPGKKRQGALCVICDMDQVVAASGNGRKEVQEKYISKVSSRGTGRNETVFWQRLMRRNISGCSGNRKKDNVWESITPIICEGDVVGGSYFTVIR